MYMVTTHHQTDSFTWTLASFFLEQNIASR
jgi:hypothetical protein